MGLLLSKREGNFFTNPTTKPTTIGTSNKCAPIADDKLGAYYTRPWRLSAPFFVYFLLTLVNPIICFDADAVYYLVGRKERLERCSASCLQGRATSNSLVVAGDDVMVKVSSIRGRREIASHGGGCISVARDFDRVCRQIVDDSIRAGRDRGYPFTSRKAAQSCYYEEWKEDGRVSSTRKGDERHQIMQCRSETNPAGRDESSNPPWKKYESARVCRGGRSPWRRRRKKERNKKWGPAVHFSSLGVALLLFQKSSFNISFPQRDPTGKKTGLWPYFRCRDNYCVGATWLPSPTPERTTNNLTYCRAGPAQRHSAERVPFGIGFAYRHCPSGRGGKGQPDNVPRHARQSINVKFLRSTAAIFFFFFFFFFHLI